MNTQQPQIQILSQEQEDDGFSLGNLWKILKRRWWIIILTFVIVLGLMVVYITRQTDIYQSSVVVKLPGQSSSSGLMSSLGAFLPFGRSSGVSTEIEMVKLRSISEKVIKKLEIDKKEMYQRQDWRQIVSGFRNRIRAKQKGTSNLMEITVTWFFPEEARDIVNAVADEYIQLSNVSKQKLWDDLKGQMAERLANVAVELQASRTLLHSSEAEADITTAFSPVLIGGGPSVTGGGTQYIIPETVRTIGELKANIVQMEVQLDTMLKSYPESAPNVIKLKNQIAASKQRHEQEEKIAVEKYNKQFGLTNDAARVMFNQQLYATLVTKQEELKAQHMMQMQSPEIVEEAVIPMFPVGPNKFMNFMLGMFLGGTFGIGAAFFVEFRDKSMHIEEDVQTDIGIPVLLKLPRRRKIYYIFNRRNKRHRNLAIISDSDSFRNKNVEEFSRESYRMFQLELAATATKEIEHEGGLSLLMTSSIQGEGKSEVAINLAISMAQSGRKVLLVGADSRISDQYKMLESNDSIGLIDTLAKSDTWDNIIRDAESENLYVISAGGTDEQLDLSDLLISSRLDEFIKTSKRHFDVIIFDSSPVTLASASPAIGSKVDGIVLVIEANHTHKETILQAIQRLENSGGMVLGSVMNHVAIKKKYSK